MREREDSYIAQFYTLTEVSMMGDPWFPSEPGAKGIQSYWCKVAEEEWNVMVGKQVRDDGTPAIAVGEQIYGDLMKKVSSGSGNNYWKFKSEKIPEGTPRPQQAPKTPAQATAQQAIGDVPGWFLPVANQIADISKKVDAIFKDIGGEFTETHKVNDAYIAPVVDEPEPVDKGSDIDPDTEKALKDIFGD